MKKVKTCYWSYNCCNGPTIKWLWFGCFAACSRLQTVVKSLQSRDHLQSSLLTSPEKSTEKLIKGSVLKSKQDFQLQNRRASEVSLFWGWKSCLDFGIDLFKSTSFNDQNPSLNCGLMLRSTCSFFSPPLNMEKSCIFLKCACSGCTDPLWKEFS